MGRPKRFGDFKSQVPQLSDRLLSTRLKELEEHGVVTRVVRGTRPIHVEYHLTEKGTDLAPVVDAIQSWAENGTDHRHRS